MYRIDTADSVAMPPTPAPIGSPGYYKPSTIVSADALNMIQESLISTLDNQSISHSKTVHTRFLDAINALVDAKVAAATPALRGHISGLRVDVDDGLSTFDVNTGSARDTTGTTTMINNSLFSLNASVSWNLTTGAMASGSGNTWADPYFGRLWQLGKVGASTTNFGLDVDPNAVNLLDDALSDGFTLARQIGWVVRVGAGFLKFVQSVEDMNFWKLEVPRTALSEEEIPINTETEELYDLDVPEGTIHLGTHSIETAPVPQLGGRGVPPFGNAIRMRMGSGIHPSTDAGSNFFEVIHHASTLDIHLSSRVLQSNTHAGTAVNQGALSFHIGAPFVVGATALFEYTIATQGFYWSRELF